MSKKTINLCQLNGRNMTNKEIAGVIANQVIEKLRAKHFDAVNKDDKWHDISSEIHNAIFYTIGEKFRDRVIANPIDKPIKLEITDIKKEAKERYDNSCSTLSESVWGQHGFIDGAKWILEKLDSNSNASL